MKSVQWKMEIRQASGQDLLEASEWYLTAQGPHRNQEDQDALEDPGESEEGEKDGWSLSVNT